jgi:hypothetical protein
MATPHPGQRASSIGIPHSPITFPKSISYVKSPGANEIPFRGGIYDRELILIGREAPPHIIYAQVAHLADR